MTMQHILDWPPKWNDNVANEVSTFWFATTPKRVFKQVVCTRYTHLHKPYLIIKGSTLEFLFGADFNQKFRWKSCVGCCFGTVLNTRASNRTCSVGGRSHPIMWEKKCPPWSTTSPVGSDQTHHTAGSGAGSTYASPTANQDLPQRTLANLCAGSSITLLCCARAIQLSPIQSNPPPKRHVSFQLQTLLRMYQYKNVSVHFSSVIFSRNKYRGWKTLR